MLRNTRRVCDVETMDDFLRYYAAGWIGIPEKGKLLPARPSRLARADVNGREHRENIVTMNVIDMVGDLYLSSARYFNYEELLNKAWFCRPWLGNIEYGPLLVYVSTNGVRQSAKGHQPTYLKHKAFSLWESRVRQTINNPMVTEEAIYKVFNPVYRTPEEVLNLAKQGTRIGWAMTPNIGAYLHPESEHMLVTYKRNPVGYMPEPDYIKLFDEYSEYGNYISRSLGVKVG